MMEKILEKRDLEKDKKIKKEKLVSLIKEDEIKQEKTKTTVNFIIDESPLVLKTEKKKELKKGYREIPISTHRYPYFKKTWKTIYTPVVEKLHLQIRMNTKKRKVELRTSKKTTNPKALQRATDFIKAINCGFEIKDAVAIIRLDDVFIQTFTIQDVKFSLKGDNLQRAIGRLAGTNGSTKYTIENSTKTRVIIANTTIHILGSFQNIIYARNSICDLILGSPPGVVFNKLRVLSRRLKESF